MPITNSNEFQTIYSAKDMSGPGTRSYEKNVSRAAAANEKAVARMHKQWAGLRQGVTVAMTAIAGVLAYGVAAAIKQENAIRKLEAALQSAGNYSKTTSQQMQDFAASLQKVTTYGDEAIIEVQAMITTLGGGTPEAVNKATKATLDLAAALKIDLKAASLLVGKAMAGETSTLSRYGIILDQARVKSEGFDYVLGQLNTKFGGQAAAAAQTFAGRMQQLHNAIGDMLEKALKPTLDAIVEWLNTGDNQKRLLDSIQGAIETLGQAVKFIADNFDLLVTAIQTFIALKIVSFIQATVVGLKAGAVSAAAFSAALKSIGIAAAVFIGIEVVKWFMDAAKAADEYRAALDLTRKSVDELSVSELERGRKALEQQQDTLRSQREFLRQYIHAFKDLGDEATLPISGKTGILYGTMFKGLPKEFTTMIQTVGDLRRIFGNLRNDLEDSKKKGREFSDELRRLRDATKKAGDATADADKNTKQIAATWRYAAPFIEATAESIDKLRLATSKYTGILQKTEADLKGKLLQMYKDLDSLFDRNLPFEKVMVIMQEQWGDTFIEMKKTAEKFGIDLRELVPPHMVDMLDYMQQQAMAWAMQMQQILRVAFGVTLGGGGAGTGGGGLNWTNVGKAAADAFTASFQNSLQNIGDIGRALSISFGSAFSAGLNDWFSQSFSEKFKNSFAGKMIGAFFPVAGQLISSGFSALIDAFSGPTNEELLAMQGKKAGQIYGDAFTDEVARVMAQVAEKIPRARSGKLDVVTAMFMPETLQAVLKNVTDFSIAFQQKFATSIGHGVNYLMSKLGLTHKQAFEQMIPIFEQLIQGIFKQGVGISQGIIDLLTHAKNLGVDVEQIFDGLQSELDAQQQAIADAEAEWARLDSQIQQNQATLYGYMQSLVELRRNIHDTTQQLLAMAQAGTLAYTATRGGEQKTFEGMRAFRQLRKDIFNAQTKRGIIRFGAAQKILEGVSPEAQTLVQQYIEMLNQKALMKTQIETLRKANQIAREQRNKIRDDLPIMRQKAEETAQYLKELRDYFITGQGVQPGGGGGDGGRKPGEPNRGESSVDVNVRYDINTSATVTGSDALTRQLSSELLDDPAFVKKAVRKFKERIESNPGEWI